MAMRKMTFTLPEELAVSFTRAVGPSRRSKYVTEALKAKLREREEMLKEACLAANDDPETQQIQAEFDALPDTMNEAWDDSASR
jgi:metal-responsive CopG/Arc/MetJ family transcriptional regulator